MSFYNYKARVIKVIDGDTVDVSVNLGFNITIKERMRLYGVDTPETRTRDKEEKVRGLAAKEFVKTRIEGKEVTINTEKGTGKFGRYLAVITYKEGDFNIELNRELVEKGFASEYFGGKRK